MIDEKTFLEALQPVVQKLAAQHKVIRVLTLALVGSVALSICLYAAFVHERGERYELRRQLEDVKVQSAIDKDALAFKATKRPSKHRQPVTQ